MALDDHHESSSGTGPETGPPSRTASTLRALGTAVAIVAAILFINFGSLPVRPSLGQMIIGFIAISAALEVMRWVRRGVRRQARRRLARMIVEYGGGVYGTVAVATWAYLQGMDVYGDLVAAGSVAAFLATISLGWLISEAIEAFVFGIRALLWPWYWFSAHGFLVPWLVAGGVALVDGVRKPVRRWLAARRRAQAPQTLVQRSAGNRR